MFQENLRVRLKWQSTDRNSSKRVDETLRFDFDDVNAESLNEDSYYEILHEHLRTNLDFALEIEKGNYPDWKK